MRRLFLKNYDRTKSYYKWELEYLVLKAFSSDVRVSFFYRFFFYNMLYTRGWEFSKVKISNRCSITYRSGGYLRMFKLSRLVVRKLSSFGVLPGIRRSSW